MSILTVIHYPDPRLRQVTKPVTVFDAELKQFVQDMIATMYVDKGIGLAATQVADSRALFVMDVSAGQQTPRCYINPTIKEAEGTHTQEEGCLSFPGVYAAVTRAARIVVSAMNEQGEPFEHHAEGLEARCILHEMDHLKGKMFIDHLSTIKRAKAEKRYQKLDTHSV